MTDWIVGGLSGHHYHCSICKRKFELMIGLSFDGRQTVMCGYCAHEVATGLLSYTGDEETEIEL